MINSSRVNQEIYKEVFKGRINRNSSSSSARKSSTAYNHLSFLYFLSFLSIWDSCEMTGSSVFQEIPSRRNISPMFKTSPENHLKCSLRARLYVSFEFFYKNFFGIFLGSLTEPPSISNEDFIRKLNLIFF